jgi:hypothetical protein
MLSALLLNLAPADLAPRRALRQRRTVSVARGVALASKNLPSENAAPNDARAIPRPIQKVRAHAGSRTGRRVDVCLRYLGRSRFGGRPR